MEPPNLSFTEQPIVFELSTEDEEAYQESLRFCERLGLIEMLEHGPESYARVTADGIRAFGVLMRLISYATNPNNTLKQG